MNLALALPVVFNGSIAVDIIISILLAGFIGYCCFRFKLANKVIITTIVAMVLLIISVIFNFALLRSMTIVAFAFFTIYASVLLTSQEKETELRQNKKISKKESALTVDEKDELIANLQKAIEMLSQTQTGALITLEKTDDLLSITQKSGTRINALGTPELIGTIFYKGTPLHDGATIIRGNMIIFSAVFYQPTQKPLNGKYGSRHRAAIGISEVCDAITIVVSEETGKVSIAYKGELVPVPVAEFSNKLKEYLTEEL